MRTAVLLPMLLLAACGLPPLTSEDVYGLSPTPRVWLQGVVTDARTMAPVADATVQLEGETTRTDANGTFRLESGLLAGATSLTVSRAGFATSVTPLLLRAGANRVEVQLEVPSCAACASDEVCDDANGRCVKQATVSGDVVDDCTGQGIAAKVTLAGASTCSGDGKGYFELKRLAPGGPHTLAIGRQDYQALSSTLTLNGGLNALGQLRLKRVGGCASTPQPLACLCTTANCQ
jgi:hypothetical protein